MKTEGHLHPSGEFFLLVTEGLVTEGFERSSGKVYQVPFWGKPHEWSSHRPEPPTFETMDQYRQTLTKLFSWGLEAPHKVVCSGEGGLALIWTHEGFYLEVEILNEGGGTILIEEPSLTGDQWHAEILPLEELGLSRLSEYLGSCKPLASIDRNYPQFPFCWVRRSLVCGESYEGITTVDLDTGVKISGHLGWCSDEFHPSPNEDWLAIVGCIWGVAGYEVRIYDVSKDPLGQPLDWPLKAHERELDTVHKWIDEDTVELWFREEWFNHPGHPTHGKSEYDMTNEEYEQAVELTDFFEETGGPDPWGYRARHSKTLTLGGGPSVG